MSLAGAQSFSAHGSAGVIQHDVDLSHYGRLQRRGPRRVSQSHPSLFVQQEAVFVSGEFLRPAEEQHKLTRIVWEDRSTTDVLPIAEQTFVYAEVVGDRIVLQEINRRTRSQGNEVEQSLYRMFGADGRLEGELHVFNESVYGQRWYRFSEDGLLVQEERYNEDGHLISRKSYIKRGKNSAWSVSGSVFLDGHESLYVKQPVLALPAFAGLNTDLAFLPEFLFYDSPEDYFVDTRFPLNA
ncbi:TPA: hypothetical protein DEB00_03810 [Candidatus Uhrbacteria bacterium]|nr:hypothetical protein [Candidatus Uhrbacteria bacterium]